MLYISEYKNSSLIKSASLETGCESIPAIRFQINALSYDVAAFTLVMNGTVGKERAASYEGGTTQR